MMAYTWGLSSQGELLLYRLCEKRLIEGKCLQAERFQRLILLCLERGTPWKLQVGCIYSELADAAGEQVSK